MTDQQTALTGPWTAVLADRHGFVYATFALALDDLGADHDEEMEISVRRGSAAPVEQHGNLRNPGSYSSGDLAYELDDVWLVDPDDPSIGAEARYAQAVAMATGLNMAATKQDAAPEPARCAFHSALPDAPTDTPDCPACIRESEPA